MERHLPLHRKGCGRGTTVPTSRLAAVFPYRCVGFPRATMVVFARDVYIYLCCGSFDLMALRCRVHATFCYAHSFTPRAARLTHTHTHTLSLGSWRCAGGSVRDEYDLGRRGNRCRHRLRRRGRRRHLAPASTVATTRVVVVVVVSSAQTRGRWRGQGADDREAVARGQRQGRGVKWLPGGVFRVFVVSRHTAVQGCKVICRMRCRCILAAVCLFIFGPRLLCCQAVERMYDQSTGLVRSLLSTLASCGAFFFFSARHCVV